MKILHLTLTKKWFDMILSGDKTEEYRELKPYWFNRFKATFTKATGEELNHKAGTFTIGKNKYYTHIKFRNGYNKIRPAFIIECLEITIGNGKREWGAPITSTNCIDTSFVIKLGKIIETKNCK